MQHIFEVIKKIAGDNIFLVGGAVRDMYLGRQVADYDFACQENALLLAKRLALEIGATYVPLDEEYDIARVVIKQDDKHIFLDFAGLKGNDIIADLNNRDFTINALAIPLGEDISHIIDPLNGKKDIDERRITAISEANLLADPVRILRGIRLAVQLEYTIDDTSMALFIKHAMLVSISSPERIREELIRAFEYNAYKSIILMKETNLIKAVFPELHRESGVIQNKYHTLDVWLHTVEVVHQLEVSVLNDSKIINSEIKAYLDEEIVTGRTNKTLLKLSALLHDVGKPVVKNTHPQKGVIFWNHDNVGSVIARKIVKRLAFSKKEVQIVTTIVRNHMRPLFIAKANANEKAYYKFFNDTDINGVGIILHALADANGGKTKDEEKEKILYKTAQKMLNYYFEVYLIQKKAPLINGKDILFLKPHIPERKIGAILKQINELRADGKLTTRDEALIYLENIEC